MVKRNAYLRFKTPTQAYLNGLSACPGGRSLVGKQTISAAYQKATNTEYLRWLLLKCDYKHPVTGVFTPRKAVGFYFDYEHTVTLIVPSFFGRWGCKHARAWAASEGALIPLGV